MPEIDLASHLLAPDDILFASFNLEPAELRVVADAVQAGDWATARHEFIHYFQSKRVLPFGIGELPPSSQAVDADGEAALRHEMCVFGEQVALTETIPWCEIPILIPGRSPREVSCEVNQHELMHRLARAYVSTGNERYARHCMDLMLDWLQAVGPYPRTKFVSDHRSHIFWNPAECRRPRVWSYAFFALLRCPVVTDPERIVVIKLLLREVAWIRENFQGNPHQCIATYYRLMEFADWWPELHNHDKFMNFALNGLFLCLDDFMYADGAYVELCQYEPLEMFLDAAAIAQRHGIPLPMDYEVKAVRLFDEFLTMIAKPDGTLPALNDSDRTLDTRHSLFSRAADFFNNEEVRWLATGGCEGREPRECSKHFPYAGLFVMRSHWSRSDEAGARAFDPDATYLILDGGRNAGGEQHAHMDKLSFELYARGRTLIVDAGGGSLAGPNRHTYYAATPAHNTVIVDGCWQAQYPPENLQADQHWHAHNSPQHPGNLWVTDPCQAWHAIMWRPLEDNVWVSSDGFDLATATYDQGYTRDPMSLPEERVFVRHMRTVFFARPDYFLIWDALDGTGEHTVEALFHFPPDAESEAGADLLILAGPAGVRLAPCALTGLEVRMVCGHSEPDPQGWFTSPEGGEVPAPCAVVTARSELPLDLFTVLHPFARDAVPQFRVTPLDFGLRPQPNVMMTDRAAGAEVAFASGERDLYFFSTHPAMPYTARSANGDEWSVAARVCVIRLDADGAVRKLHASHASVIRRNGETVFAGEGLEMVDVEYEIAQVLVRRRGYGSISLLAQSRTLALSNGDPVTNGPGQERFDLH